MTKGRRLKSLEFGQHQRTFLFGKDTPVALISSKSIRQVMELPTIFTTNGNIRVR